MCFQYASDYKFDEEQTEDLWYFIAVMDIEFLDWWLKKQPKPRKGAKHGNPDPERPGKVDAQAR